MNIIKITDINMQELDVFHDISEPQLLHYYEPQPGLFIAESPMIISRALSAGYEPETVLIENRSEEFITKVLQQSGLTRYFADANEGDRYFPVYAAPLKDLNKITGYALTRGILCAMRRKPHVGAEQLLEHAKRVVILENVMNPTNAGAIFRSAAALGMDAVLLTGGSTDPLYRRAARVSMGTVFQIPWTYLQNWPEDIGVLKNMGFQIAAMTLSSESISLKDFNPHQEEKIALIMGTEGPGLSPETVAACDISVKIPMSHGVDSLNVAAASAVAFWQINYRKL